jgi:hypothetical protein
MKTLPVGDCHFQNIRQKRPESNISTTLYCIFRLSLRMAVFPLSWIAARRYLARLEKAEREARRRAILEANSDWLNREAAGVLDDRGVP